VISGDGRYYNREAVQVIAKIAVAHGVSTLWIGQVENCFVMIYFYFLFLFIFYEPKRSWPKWLLVCCSCRALFVRG
jgi:hypothetical protein